MIIVIPSYLKDEVERIHKRCIRLIKSKRKEGTTKDLSKISSDKSQPLHNRAAVTRNCDYNLKTNCRKLVPISGTNRQKNSFLPRALQHN